VLSVDTIQSKMDQAAGHDTFFRVAMRWPNTRLTSTPFIVTTVGTDHEPDVATPIDRCFAASPGVFGPRLNWMSCAAISDQVPAVHSV
jgi:hypothetical protein